MKTFRKISMLMILAAGLYSSAHSQNGYSTAVGLRGGWTSGLTFKQFLGGSTAFEGILSAWPYDLSVTGLIEKHKAIPSTPGLSYYYGGGAHMRFFTRYDRSYYFYRGRYWVVTGPADHGTGLGIDGILGLEYKVANAPVAFSIDIKPFLEIGTSGYFLLVPDVGLGIKAAF